MFLKTSVIISKCQLSGGYLTPSSNKPDIFIPLGDHIVYNASSRAGLTQRRAAVRWTANTRNPCPHADDAMVSVICWRSWAEPRRTGNELYAEMRAKMLNRRLSIISTKHTGDLKRKKQPRKHDQLSYQHQARKRWEIRFFHGK